MSTLLIPSNLELLTTESAGRTLSLNTDASKGAVVLTDTPFCHVIHQKFRSTTCDLCYAFAETGGEPLQQACDCGIHYCSEACQLKAFPRHHAVCELTNRMVSVGSERSELLSTVLNDKQTPITHRLAPRLTSFAIHFAHGSPSRNCHTRTTKN